MLHMSGVASAHMQQKKKNISIDHEGKIKSGWFPIAVLCIERGWDWVW
jgi:hypothetical protein